MRLAHSDLRLDLRLAHKDLRLDLRLGQKFSKDLGLDLRLDITDLQLDLRLGDGDLLTSLLNSNTRNVVNLQQKQTYTDGSLLQ